MTDENLVEFFIHLTLLLHYYCVSEVDMDELFLSDASFKGCCSGLIQQSGLYPVQFKFGFIRYRFTWIQLNHVTVN